VNTDHVNIDIKKILKMIPQKPPFLMIDGIIELVPGERVVAIKNVSINEPYFIGHFPNNPIVPGVLLLEAMGQAGQCAIFSDERFANKLILFAGANNVKFRRPAVPGDTLIITGEISDTDKKFGKLVSKIEANDTLICEGELSFFISDTKF
jgi:3-hydroxyacyl-[acyl-carrier-protein] dehydratase